MKTVRLLKFKRVDKSTFMQDKRKKNQDPNCLLKDMNTNTILAFMLEKIVNNLTKNCSFYFFVVNNYYLSSKYIY